MKTLGNMTSSKSYLIVLLNIILEIIAIALQLYAFQNETRPQFWCIDATFLGIVTLFLIFSIAWIFALHRQCCFGKLPIIKGIQAAIMISNGAVFLIYLLQDKLSAECLQELNLEAETCKEFEVRAMVGFLAILDGFLYLARRPILPEFIVEMEQEDSHFHRRFLGDGQDYFKEPRRNSRGSVILDQEGRGMYASYPQLDDYIVKVDVLPEFPNPGVLAGNNGNEENLKELSDLDISASSKTTNRGSFFLNQEYFLPNLPKRSSKMGNENEDGRYSTLSKDFVRI